MNSKNTKAKRKNNFCIQPFVNTTTRITGNHSVCCNITNKFSNIKDQSINDFFNSDDIKKMRQDMLDNKHIKECVLCHYLEENGQTSHRREYNKYWMIDENKDAKKQIEKLKFDSLQNPAYAEIHISNLCNLKCLTCNEKDSSKFHAENKELGVSKNPNIDYTKFVTSTTASVNSVLTNDLRFLDLRGGETLMVPEIKKLLLNVDTEKTKNVILKVQTNGTQKIDDKWLKIFSKFKRVKFNISVDAYGEDNHYIRYPSEWNKILETIETCKKNDVKIIINTVISNLNILVLDKLLSWVAKEKHLQYFYILKNPVHYQYKNLPQKLLDIACIRLKSLKVDFVNKNMNNELEKLILNLQQNKFNPDNFNNFIKEIRLRDNYRCNNIVNIIPELKEYIDAN